MRYKEILIFNTQNAIWYNSHTICYWPNNSTIYLINFQAADSFLTNFSIRAQGMNISGIPSA